MYTYSNVLNKYNMDGDCMKYIKMCRHCGHYFETNSPQKQYCDLPHYRPCPVCGKATKMIVNNDFNRPQRCCSSECTHKLRTMKFKMKLCAICGDEFYPNSGCQTVCEKTHYRKCEICGSPFIITAKTYKTMTTCSHECSQKKLQNFFLEKYGATHPMKTEIGQQHFHDSFEKIYGVRHALQKKEFADKMKYTNLLRHNVEYYCVTPECRNVSGNAISELNLHIQAKLADANIQTITEFPIKNRGYDLKIVDSNILIEINPTYTHNIIGNHWNPDGLDKYYHRDKTQLAEDNGFKCVNIWDWDNINKIVEWLKPREIIDASEFGVYKLTTKSANEFLKRYHIFGSHRGQVLCLGLVKDGVIYQIMTFCKSKNKKYYTQLCRWCTLPGYEIFGGYDKLSSYASEQFGVTNVIAYVDRSKADGSELESIGMKLDHITPPRLIWSKGKQYINSSLIISGKSKYHSDEDLLNDGWLPIYDCGQRVYVC